ncbi:MAG: nitroreductase [Pseudomonadota bacterium]
MDVTEALTRRRSVRAFLENPVSEETIRQILTDSARSPSGGNLQPWRVVVVTGEEQAAITKAAQATLFANPAGEEGDYPIYPKPLGEPYRTRRFQVGEDLYASLGVPREDKAARFAWVAENFTFFGAPVGLFFITRKSFGHGQWAHMGMLMQSIALRAEAEGLGTCMQEAWAMVRNTLHGHFALEEDELLYCGMALGHPDTDAAVNQWRSRRDDLDEWCTFRGF